MGTDHSEQRKLAFIVETDKLHQADLKKLDPQKLSTAHPEIANSNADFDVEILWEGSETTLYRLELPVHRQLSRAEWFDLAESLRGLLMAVSCEPDLPSEYYIDPDEGQDPSGEINEAAFQSTCKASVRPPEDYRWHLPRVGLPTRPLDLQPQIERTVLIAQPDTGITSHPDLPPAAIHRLARGFYKEETFSEIDMLHGGALRAPGHGTGTGSVIIAAGDANDDDQGRIMGAAPDAMLVPLRCIKSVIRFEQSRVAQAVKYAADNGCHVISMSLGGLPSRALLKAIEHAVQKGLIVLAAAGNCVGVVVYPARYKSCIAVAGTNVDDGPWVGSSKGNAVNISAPAQHVWRARPLTVSSVPQPGEGTSFATAITAGIAARWISKHGHDQLTKLAKESGTTVQTLFLRSLQATARTDHSLPSGHGAGIVNASALLALPLEEVAFLAEERESALGELDPLLHLVREVVQVEELESAGGASLSSIPDHSHDLEIAALALDRAKSGISPRPSRSLTAYVQRVDVPSEVRQLVEDATESTP